MRFITITLIVHAPDPHGDDAVPARAVAVTG
jgi:hypothetical protein